MMGGNAVLRGLSAQRIDLSKINRTDIVQTLTDGLEAINQKFLTNHRIPLWSPELFASRKYLTGSAYHLFNPSISDTDFVAVKEKVGDIDVQVDSNMRVLVEDFLYEMPPHSTVGPFIFIDFKFSVDQFITLWNVPDFNINVQIDIGLVSYVNGEPSEWAQFSHGSDWEDMQKGVKGVFQIYCLRAFQARSVRAVIILPKTSRGKEKIIFSSDLAFSLRGLRVKLKPVLDNNGQPLTRCEVPICREIDTKNSTFITDLDTLFTTFFGIRGSQQEIEKMRSFIGLLELSTKYFTEDELRKVLMGFTNLLWGSGEQELVRGNPEEDYNTKKTAFDLMIKTFGVGSIEEYQPLINNFYEEHRREL